MSGLLCEPIGYLRCERQERFLAPRQPLPAPGCVELIDGLHLDMALRDLDGFSRIWLIWWCHRNSTWRPTVLPPHSRSGRKGVLATRSPHRPNPLALSAVPLTRIEGRKLYLGEHDLLDGTPILDIKPYIPRIDSFAEERIGWQTDLEETESYRVHLSKTAERQISWLTLHYHAEFRARVLAVLTRYPQAQKSRRVARLPDGTLRLGCGPYRVYYMLEGQDVRVDRVESFDTHDLGMRARFEAEAGD